MHLTKTALAFLMVCAVATPKPAQLNHADLIDMSNGERINKLQKLEKTMHEAVEVREKHEQDIAEKINKMTERLTLSKLETTLMQLRADQMAEVRRILGDEAEQGYSPDKGGVDLKLPPTETKTEGGAGGENQSEDDDQVQVEL